jgi:hypothetical protein
MIAVAAFSLLFASCTKEALHSENDVVPQLDNSRTTGAIDDDLSVSEKIPVVMSQEFLANSKGIMSDRRNIVLRGRKDNTPPSVSFLSPANGASVSGAVSVQIKATDNVSVASVKLYVDGQLVNTLTAAPWNFTWNSAIVSNGLHSLTAIALDKSANSSSASIQVSVSNQVQGDITNPNVSITSPSSGASVSGTVSVTASASDNVGVSSVKFYVDGALASSSSVAPYAFSWNTSGVANGTHTLMATAFDAAGNSNSTSIPVSVNTTVLQPGPIPSSYQLAMPVARNQGTEGSCVSFAAVYGARSAEQYYKTNASSYSDGVNLFSPEFTFNQVNLGGSCTSSSVVPTLDLLKTKGVCTWQSMPYSTSNGCSLMPTTTQNTEAAQFKISSYSTIISQDITAIKTTIASKHAVIVTLNIDQQFYNATPGFIWKSFTGNAGYHAIVLCGYDDSKHAFKALNSWGTNWGDQGYIWIDYDFLPTVSSYYLYTLNL